MPDAYTVIVVDDTSSEEVMRESCHSYLINYFSGEGTGTAGHISTADTIRGYARIRERIAQELTAEGLKDLDDFLDNMLANQESPNTGA